MSKKSSNFAVEIKNQLVMKTINQIQFTNEELNVINKELAENETTN